MRSPLAVGARWLIAAILPAWLLVTSVQAARIQAPSASVASAVSLPRLKQLSEAALAQRHLHRAATLFQQAVGRDPRWKEGWWRLGILLYEGHQFPAARVAFTHLTRLNRRLGTPWVMRGLCDFELRDFGLSLAHLQEGLALGLPQDANLRQVAFYHEAQDMLMLRNYDQALLVLRYFPMQQHRTAGVLYALGLAALRIPLLSETLPRTISAARLNLIRQVGLAEYLAGRRKFPAARQVIAAAIREHPRLPYLHYIEAELWSLMGHSRLSEQDFLAELKLNPASVPARLQLAADDLDANRLARAARLLQAALRLQPQNYAAHYLQGMLLMQQRHYHAAWRALRASKLIAPNDSQIRYALSQVDLRLHRMAAARREQRAFQRLRPLESSMLQKGVLPASAYLPKPVSAPDSVRH